MNTKIVNPDDINEPDYDALEEAKIHNIEFWENEVRRGYIFTFYGQEHSKSFPRSCPFNIIAEEALGDMDDIELAASGYDLF